MKDVGVHATGFAVIVMLATATAGAQELDTQNFQAATTLEGLTVSRGGHALDAGEVAAGAQCIYGNRLLLVRDRVTDKQWGLVQHRLDLAVSYAQGLGNMKLSMLAGVDVALTVPVVLWQHQQVQLDGQDFTEEARNSVGIGDPRVQARMQLLSVERAGIDLAIIPSLRLPLARGGDYFGSDSVIFTPSLVVSAPLRSFNVVVDLGWRMRENAEVGGIWITDQLVWRAGAGFDLDSVGATADSAIMAEVFGLTRATRPFRSTRQSPTEWLLSARYAVGDFVASMGVGGSLANGYATPSVRALLGLTWVQRLRSTTTTTAP